MNTSCGKRKGTVRHVEGADNLIEIDELPIQIDSVEEESRHRDDSSDCGRLREPADDVVAVQHRSEATSTAARYHKFANVVPHARSTVIHGEFVKNSIKDVSSSEVQEVWGQGAVRVRDKHRLSKHSGKRSSIAIRQQDTIKVAVLRIVGTVRR